MRDFSYSHYSSEGTKRLSNSFKVRCYIFFCDYIACVDSIWIYKYLSNPFPSYFCYCLLSILSLYNYNSLLTGTMPLFSTSSNFFFIVCQSTFLKYKSIHFILLIKILQWFSVACKMKFKLLIMAHPSSGSCLHFQHHFVLLPLPHTAFQ